MGNSCFHGSNQNLKDSAVLNVDSKRWNRISVICASHANAICTDIGIVREKQILTFYSIGYANVNKKSNRCNSMQIFIHCKTTLYVSGVTAPIIRSIKNCPRSLRYRSYYLYRYSPPTWSGLN